VWVGFFGVGEEALKRPNGELRGGEKALLKRWDDT